MTEQGVEIPDVREDYCPVWSPGGWHCCLPKGHDRNHIGTTRDFGTLYQWPQEPVAATS